ncbi:tRNA preQ1(34) S-adenosylmethionine ribosyltransferase-isomerase QueA [bacterium]|nr:tRNA preQ1(34) S-adenosylmethionine ribosyltransferase-isomerase QueA [bacterium]
MVESIFNIETYDYNLPEELVAQYPVERRDESRLLVLDRRSGHLEEGMFRDIVKYFKRGDILVLNDTKVFPARLYGRKRTGGRVEVFLLERVDDDIWRVLTRPSRRVRVGTEIVIADGFSAEVISRESGSSRLVRFRYSGDFFSLLDRFGHIPLPHYIKREETEQDRERYQTVFARTLGAVAAPTAGLHFTKELLETLSSVGVEIVYLTLNVGWGTFERINTVDIRKHRMHSEYYEISDTTAKAINKAYSSSRRIVAVGTTTVRALESQEYPVSAGSGWTDLFIHPPYRFKFVDALITNFHIPRSSLLVLVSAFAGIENIKRAYRYAIDNSFRFFSYGDAMLIV